MYACILRAHFDADYASEAPTAQVSKQVSRVASPRESRRPSAQVQNQNDYQGKRQGVKMVDSYSRRNSHQRILKEVLTLCFISLSPSLPLIFLTNHELI